MEDQVKQITELFAAPRGELQLVVNFSGIKIYTSSKLKQSYIKAMAKTSRTAPVVSTIIKLITNGELFPCYLTKKILDSILKKQPPEFKGYAGTTMGKYILVYVEADSNIFGFASNNELSITTLHELIHKSSNKFTRPFFELFKKELVEYYSYFWDEVFSLKVNSIDKKKVEDIVRYIFFEIEKKGPSNDKLINYHKMLTETLKPITTLDEKTFETYIQQYIVLIKIIWKAMESKAPNLIYKAGVANKHIITHLYGAYTNTFGIHVKHIKEFCYQELYAPSEVISVPALIKRPDQKVYKLINKL